jgi:hypothetical protein
MAYASIEDYQVITGSVVPEAEVPRVTRQLTTASDLFALYLGDREAEVVANYASLLADLVVARVYRLAAMPIGIRSESVGGSSVTYDSVGASPFGLTGDEVRLLSMMLTGGRATSLRSVVMSSQGIVTVTADEETA